MDEKTFTSVGAAEINHEMYRLYICDQDKKWYKSKIIKYTRVDPYHHTPEIPVYGDIELVTEKDKVF